MNTNKKKLHKNLSFFKSSHLVLKEKYKIVKEKVDNYLQDPSVENLHKLRISIRRLRYSLENFRICFDKKKYKYVLSVTKYLQDLIGEARDLDMLKEKLAIYFQEGEIIVIPDSLYKILEEKKSKIEAEIKISLINFIQDKKITKVLLKRSVK